MRGRLVLAALALLVPSILVGCGSGLRSAAETIARQTGRTTSEIESAFRLALKGSSEDEIAAAAVKAADRNRWLESLGARLALGTERQRTLQAITGATCDVISLVSDFGAAATPEQARRAIIANIRAQQLPESEAKVGEIVKGIIAQVNALASNGSLDLGQASIDLACILYG